MIVTLLMSSLDRNYYQHPKFEDIVKRCPGSEDQAKLAFQVYMDLIEARGWWDVDLHHSEMFQLIFVSGRPSRQEAKNLFVPIDVTQEVSPQQMHRFCEHITLADHTTHGITLAMCEKDSSTTYFKVSNSLIAPATPEVTELKKRKRVYQSQHRRDHLNTEILQFCAERKVPEVSVVNESDCYKSDEQVS